MTIILLKINFVLCTCFSVRDVMDSAPRQSHSFCVIGVNVCRACLTWLSCSVSSQPSTAKHTVSLHWGHTQTRSRIVCTTAEEWEWKGERENQREREIFWGEITGRKTNANNCDRTKKCFCLTASSKNGAAYRQTTVCMQYVWARGNEFYQKWCGPVWDRAVQ